LEEVVNLFLDKDLTDLLKYYPDLVLVQVRSFRLRYWTEVDDGKPTYTYELILDIRRRDTWQVQVELLKVGHLLESPDLAKIWQFYLKPTREDWPSIWAKWISDLLEIGEMK